MSAADLELQRAADRTNKRFSRNRQKLRMEELRKKNGDLTKANRALMTKLAVVEKEVESLRAQLDDLRSILAAAVQTFDNAPSSTLEPPSFRIDEGNTGRELRRQHRPHLHSHEALGNTAPIEPVRTTFAQPFGPITEYTDPTFNGIINGYMTDLPDEFGHGMTLNLLSEMSVVKHSLSKPSADSGIATLGTVDKSMSEPRYCSSQADTVTTYTAPPSHSSLPDGILDHQLRVLDSSPSLSASLSSSAPCRTSTGRLPEWSMIPLHSTPTNALDRMFLRVTTQGRSYNQRNQRHYDELSEPSFPSISSLLNPATELDTAELKTPVATALGQHAWSSTVVSFPARVAIHYSIALLLRWIISPSPQSWLQLPQFLRPTELQKTVAHPAWIDAFAW